MSFSSDPIRLRAGQGETIWQLGNVLTVKAGPTDSGAYSLGELVFAGMPPPMHIRDREEEAFYVLDGSLDVFMRDDVMRAASGDFCLIPRGAVHSLLSTSLSPSTEPARVLVLLRRPGFERFFAEVERRFPEASGIPDPAEVGPAPETMGRAFGMRTVGPPPEPRGR